MRILWILAAETRGGGPAVVREKDGGGNGAPRRRGTERKIRLELLPASEVVIPDLEAAENDYYQAKFGNFTEEEIRQYTLLARKVRENERSILQRG